MLSHNCLGLYAMQYALRMAMAHGMASVNYKHTLYPVVPVYHIIIRRGRFVGWPVIFPIKSMYRAIHFLITKLIEGLINYSNIVPAHHRIALLYYYILLLEHTLPCKYTYMQWIEVCNCFLIPKS